MALWAQESTQANCLVPPLTNQLLVKSELWRWREKGEEMRGGRRWLGLSESSYLSALPLLLQLGQGNATHQTCCSDRTTLITLAMLPWGAKGGSWLLRLAGQHPGWAEQVCHSNSAHPRQLSVPLLHTRAAGHWTSCHSHLPKFFPLRHLTQTTTT